MKIRKATPEDIAGISKVHVDSWRETYKGIVPGDYLAGLRYERREELWHQVFTQRTTLVFVAENEQGQIVGFISGGPYSPDHSDRYTAELSAIYLLEKAQGFGVGKRLVVELFKALAQQEHDTVHVWVLEDNKSKHFYEHLGAAFVENTEIEIGGRKLQELGLGWDAAAFQQLVEAFNE